MKNIFLSFFTLLILASGAASAASMTFSTDCFTGVEQLANGKRNTLALCPKKSKVLLSEEANGDQMLDIVSGKDMRGTDGNLEVELSNGDKFVVTAGFNPSMTVEYFLVRNGKSIVLTPVVQVQLQK